jgi:hypothetical protein
MMDPYGQSPRGPGGEGVSLFSGSDWVIWALKLLTPVQAREAALTFGVLYAVLLLRYALVSGGTYFLVWVWGARRFAQYKIQGRGVLRQQIRSEQNWSCLSFVYFALLVTLVLWARATGGRRASWGRRSPSGGASWRAGLGMRWGGSSRGWRGCGVGRMRRGLRRCVGWWRCDDRPPAPRRLRSARR